MENKLNEWYQKKKASGESITAKMVKEKAKEFSQCSDFIASKGWLDKFKLRYKLDIEKEGNRTSSFSHQTSEKGEYTNEMNEESDS